MTSPRRAFDTHDRGTDDGSVAHSAERTRNGTSRDGARVTARTSGQGATVAHDAVDGSRLRCAGRCARTRERDAAGRVHGGCTPERGGCAVERRRRSAALHRGSRPRASPHARGGARRSGGAAQVAVHPRRRETGPVRCTERARRKGSGAHRRCTGVQHSSAARRPRARGHARAGAYGRGRGRAREEGGRRGRPKGPSVERGRGRRA